MQRSRCPRGASSPSPILSPGASYRSTRCTAGRSSGPRCSKSWAFASSPTIGGRSTCPASKEEIVQIQKHGIEYFAFWDFHPDIVPLLGKYHVTPQFWVVVPSPPGTNENEKVEAAAKQLRPLAEKTRALGCKLGLYNHGGWGGEPASMVAVAKRLRQDGRNDHVGIVYNFHHGHGHISDFAEVLTAMQPYLLCINLNGMNDNARPLILPIGSGRHERKMMEAIRHSGYAGPIGILGHREEMDAEVSLRQNLYGMKKVLKEMGDEAALKTYN